MQLLIKPRSCLLCSLLPSFATTAATLLSVAVARPAFCGKGIAGAERKGGGCQAIGEVDLCADSVCEVGNDEDVLDMGVAAAYQYGKGVEGVERRTNRARCRPGQPWEQG